MPKSFKPINSALPLSGLLLFLWILPASLRADHVMIAENWIVNRDTVEVEAENFNDKLVINLHFASSHHKVCLRFLYKEKHGSAEAKEGLWKLLEILRDPETTSISDPELGSRIGLTFVRILNPKE